MSFQLVISKEWYHSFDLVLWRVNSNWGLSRNLGTTLVTVMDTIVNVALLPAKLDGDPFPSIREIN